MNLKPDMYKKDVFQINYDLLKQMNIKNIFFDLDNTLLKYQDDLPSKEVINLINKLNKILKCFYFLILIQKD